MNSRDLESYLKFGLTLGIFTVPFIVFIVINDMFFPFITGKNFAFRVLIELMLGGWIILAYLNEEYRPKLSAVAVAIALLVVIVGVADILGVNFEKSFWSNYERMEGYITILHLFAYFVVLISFLKVQKRWDQLFNVMIVASCVMGLIGLGELIKNDFQVGRLSTTLGNAIYLAVYMLFHIFITLYCLFRDEIKNWGLRHYFYIGALILQTVNLYFTATRGTILGLIGGLLLTALLIALFETRRKTLRKLAIGMIVAIVIFVGLFVGLKDASFMKQSPVLNRFATISLDSGTAATRFTIWNMAYQGFKERPLLGWGQGNFPYVFNKYYDPELYSAEPWFDRAHNVFFDWLTAAGIFGLTSYLLIFVAALYQLWRKKEDDFTIVGKSILTGLLAAYFFHNIFVFDNLISYILFFTIIAYIHFRSTHADIFSGSLHKINHFFQTVGSKIGINKEDMTIPALMFIITPLMIYAVNYAPYMQNKTLISALRQYPEGVQKNLDLYKKALSYDSFGNSETRERLLFQAMNVNGQQVDQEIKNDYRDLAIKEIQKQIEEIPGDAKYPLFATSLLKGFGRVDEAKEMIEKAREISPKKQMILFNLGSIYLERGEYGEALETYKEAYEASPEYKEAAKRYGLAALYAGDEELAKEILTPVYGTHLIPDASYINFFARQDRFDVVKDLLSQMIEKEPNQPQHRFQLVGAYIELDERDKALEILEEIGVIFPNLKSNADHYINEINSGNI